MTQSPVLDSDVVFRDLTDCFNALQAEQISPVRVRRLLVEFLRFAKQMPWLLEKEFKKLTGKKMSYASFWDTNGVTKCCSKLRNTSEHDLTVRLATDETVSASLTDILGPEAPSGRRLSVVAGGRGLDPFADSLQPGIGIYPADPTTGEIDLSRPFATEHQHRFVVAATTGKIKQALDEATTNDVHVLSSLCYSALKQLFENHKADLARVVASDDEQGDQYPG